LDKSAGKYAKAADSPFSTYGFVFVLAMVIGGFVSSRFGGTKVEQSEKNVPSYWQQRMGSSKNKRRLYTFTGGVLILFGARLAGGCTSGHMMSGMMQTSISGYIFAGAVFAIAVPISLLMYKKSGSKQS
ncbi:MAG: YeeE/YedE family protein, partial [Proteobacteria bacterium]|nr:YeeE/YedE family protein [Pseudomonadota bacterium]